MLTQISRGVFLILCGMVLPSLALNSVEPSSKPMVTLTTPEIGKLAVNVTYYSAIGTQVQCALVWTASYFHPDVDSTFSGFHPHRATALKWCAVSQDLLWYRGGPLAYGDTITIKQADQLSGQYVVKDCMAPEMKKSIDILLSVGEHHHQGRWRAQLEYRLK